MLIIWKGRNRKTLKNLPHLPHLVDQVGITRDLSSVEIIVRSSAGNTRGVDTIQKEADTLLNMKEAGSPQSAQSIHHMVQRREIKEGKNLARENPWSAL